MKVRPNRKLTFDELKNYPIKNFASAVDFLLLAHENGFNPGACIDQICSSSVVMEEWVFPEIWALVDTKGIAEELRKLVDYGENWSGFMEKVIGEVGVEECYNPRALSDDLGRLKKILILIHEDFGRSPKIYTGTKKGLIPEKTNGLRKMSEATFRAFRNVCLKGDFAGGDKFAIADIEIDVEYLYDNISNMAKDVPHGKFLILRREMVVTQILNYSELFDVFVKDEEGWARFCVACAYAFHKHEDVEIGYRKKIELAYTEAERGLMMVDVNKRVLKFSS